MVLGFVTHQGLTERAARPRGSPFRGPARATDGHSRTLSLVLWTYACVGSS